MPGIRARKAKTAGSGRSHLVSKEGSLPPARGGTARSRAVLRWSRAVRRWEARTRTRRRCSGGASLLQPASCSAPLVSARSHTFAAARRAAEPTAAARSRRDSAQPRRPPLEPLHSSRRMQHRRRCSSEPTAAACSRRDSAQPRSPPLEPCSADLQPSTTAVPPRTVARSWRSCKDAMHKLGRDSRLEPCSVGEFRSIPRTPREERSRESLAQPWST